MSHKMIKISERGFGSWKQCTKCGATYYGNKWRWGGHVSSQEPGCSPSKKWISESDDIDSEED